MNKIYLDDVTPYTYGHLTIDTITNTQSRTNDIDVFFDYDNIINYAPIDVGIDLTDSTLELADEGDNCGVISKYISDNTGSLLDSSIKMWITANFDEAIDLTKGLTIKLHEISGQSNACADVYWRDANDTVLCHQSMQGSGYSIVLSNSVANVREISICVYNIPLGPKQNAKIDYIKLGKEVVVTDFIGDVQCYGEVDLDKTDLPGGTCDFTMVASDVEPLEGQYFLYEDYKGNELAYQGAYVIEEVERVAEDIYTISAHDFIEELANVSGHNWTSDLRCKNNIADFNVDYTATSKADDYNLRQWYASQVAVQNVWFIGYCDKGVKTVTMPTVSVLTITADHIIGKGQYTKNKRYKGCKSKYDSVEVSVDKPNIRLAESAGYKSISQREVVVQVSSSATSTQRLTATLNNINQYINGNTFEFTTDLKGSGYRSLLQPGTMIAVYTPYNGGITGIIESIDRSAGAHKTLSKIKIREIT